MISGAPGPNLRRSPSLSNAPDTAQPETEGKHMKRATMDNRGFTLVELVITVAIIGILASAAMSLFREQQMRSKRAEAMTNVAAITKMVKGYFGESGVYPETALYHPGLPFTPNAVQWDPVGAAPDFGAFGFQAEGGVRYRYDVVSQACGCTDCFTVEAIADLDGDFRLSEIGNFHPDASGWACPTEWVGVPPNRRGGVLVVDEPHALDAAPDRY